MDALLEAGYNVPFDVVWPIVGMGGDKVLPAAAGIEMDSQTGKALAKRRWEIFRRDYLSGLAPTPGARSLVERIKADGLMTIVATSASVEEPGPLLEASDVGDLMDITTSASVAE